MTRADTINAVAHSIYATLCKANITTASLILVVRNNNSYLFDN